MNQTAEWICEQLSEYDVMFYVYGDNGHAFAAATRILNSHVITYYTHLIV